MMTREEFQAQQAKALAVFEQQSTIGEAFAAAGLPIPEYIADGTCHGWTGVAFRNDIHKPRGLGWATELFSKFPTIIPATKMKGASSTTIHPESRLTDGMKKKGYARDSLRGSQDYACWISTRYIHDSRNISAELEFFAQVGPHFVKVSIAFGKDYIGACAALRPLADEQRGANNGNRVISRTFKPRPELLRHVDSWFNWGGYESGPIKNNFDAEYLILSDNEDQELQAVECLHALEALRLIAEEMGA